MSGKLELQTVGLSCQIGKDGPLLKTESSDLFVRNTADSDFVNVQAASAVDNNDAVPRGQWRPVSKTMLKRAYIELDHNNNGSSNIGTLGANSIVTKVYVWVKEAFNGVNATLKLGITSDDDLVQTINSTNLQLNDLYISEEYINTGAGDKNLTATLDTDSSTAGELTVVIFYYDPF